MSLTPRGQQCTSMYLSTPRPSVPRQRSNSLPVGLATMNAEEAGILFSAAERATARRRRIISIDTPSWLPPVDSPMEDISWPLPSASTIRQSVIQKSNQRQSRSLQDISIAQSSQRSVSSPTLAYNKELFKTLPIDPISPTKRQVPTHSLKSYADGLLQFTQVRLVSSVPQVSVHLASPQTGFFDDELDLSVSDASHKSRPSLESKFSDWSVAASDSRSRRGSLAVQSPPAMEIDTTLLSPDSFFGDFDETRSQAVLSRLSKITGYASSATFGPPLEPRDQMVIVQKEVKPAEEVSYFTNYQRFLDHDSNSAPQLDPPDSLNIDLSPLEEYHSPATPPPPPKRLRAGTTIRHPVIARSYSSGATVRFAHSTPTTPYHVAEIALRVPVFCVGAVG